MKIDNTQATEECMGNPTQVLVNNIHYTTYGYLATLSKNQISWNKYSSWTLICILAAFATYYSFYRQEIILCVVSSIVFAFSVSQ